MDVELAVSTEMVIVLRNRIADGATPMQALDSICEDVGHQRAKGWQQDHPNWMSYKDRRKILDRLGSWADKYVRVEVS